MDELVLIFLTQKNLNFKHQLKTNLMDELTVLVAMENRILKSTMVESGLLDDELMTNLTLFISMQEIV